MEATKGRKIEGMSVLRYFNIRNIVGSRKGAPFFPGTILFIFVIVGIFGTFFAPHDPNEANFEDALKPPSWQEGGKAAYPLGTDHLGRDVLSRLLFGTGITLQVGF